MQGNEQVNVYAISVDGPAESREFAAKISADGKGDVSFPILSDPGHRLIDAYGIRDPDYNGQKFEGIPHPSVYIIDKDGRVAWTRVETDYKQVSKASRSEPDFWRCTLDPVATAPGSEVVSLQIERWARSLPLPVLNLCHSRLSVAPVAALPALTESY